MFSRLKRDLIPLNFAAWVFLFSLFFSSLYVSGDQFHYHNFYNKIIEFDFFSGYFFYVNALGTREPGYYILAFIASRIISKNVLMSFLNAILVYLFVRWARKNHVIKSLIFMSVLNFYSFVLFLHAERLKLALLVFFLAICCERKTRLLLMVFACLFHAQIIVFAISELLVSLLRSIRKQKNEILINKKKIFAFFVFFAVLGVAVWFLRDHIMIKLSFYSSHYEHIFNLLKFIPFFALLIFYVNKKKLEAFIYVISVFFASLFVGSSRLVIFLFFIFSFYALPSQSFFKRMIFFIFALYFFTKGMSFLYNVVNHGHGFPITT